MDNSAKRKKRKYLSCGNKITQPLSTLGKQLEDVHVERRI